MNTPTTSEQLASLGYRLLTGSRRFGAAISIGKPVYAQDQVGELLKFDSSNGVISVTKAKNQNHHMRVEFQVHRNHSSGEASETALNPEG